MSEITEAYARLVALRDHLPQTRDVGDTYINEYHEILSLLERGSGAELTNFRLNKLLTSIPHTESGSISWTHLIDRNVLAMKADGLLRYFELGYSEQKPARIGFHLP